MWALTVELSVLLAHEPLNPTASAWVVFGLAVELGGVQYALIERLETSRRRPGPVLSAIEADVPAPGVGVCHGGGARDHAAAPETAWA